MWVKLRLFSTPSIQTHIDFNDFQRQVVGSIFEVSSERGGCTIPNGFAGVEDGVIGVFLSSCTGVKMTSVGIQLEYFVNV